MRSLRHAFSLVEILIVVVILGILASIVVPQFSKAVENSSETATFDQLSRVRRALTYYYATNNSQYPVVDTASGTWQGLIPDYVRETPANFWVPKNVSKKVVLGTTPDTAYQGDHGWVYDIATGEVWAGGFDQYDNPLPR